MKSKIIIFITIFAVVCSLLVVPSFAAEESVTSDVSSYNTFTFNEGVIDYGSFSDGGSSSFVLSSFFNLTFSVFDVLESDYFSVYGEHFVLYFFDSLGNRNFDDPSYYTWYFYEYGQDTFDYLSQYGTWSYTDPSSFPGADSPDEPSDPEPPVVDNNGFYQQIYNLLIDTIYGDMVLTADMTLSCSLIATCLSLLVILVPFLITAATFIWILKRI